jgi:DNA-binding HxlR family transcriptional regulator
MKPNTTKKRFNCPAEMTSSLISGKWRLILLYNLRKKEKRFGELKRLCPGITPTTLAKELRKLEELLLITRKEIYGGAMPAVEYKLTDRGESLKPILNAMIRWGITHQKDYILGEFGMASFQK